MIGSVDHKMSLKFVVFVCLIFKVSALDIKCPDHVETMPDFNPKLYVGDWYSTFSAYNSYTDETSHCVRATYKELSMFTFIPINFNPKQGQLRAPAQPLGQIKIKINDNYSCFCFR